MCIVLFTTAHPSYALIAIDNRDEYILRPTSRPYLWQYNEQGHDILSSRDLQKKEQGTWMGINRNGTLAVLTNFREPIEEPPSADSTIKSRGGMVNAWLGGLGDGKLQEGVEKLLQGGGLKTVGGFSMACGRLRKKWEGIAIVSNRVDDVNDVPVLGTKRGETWGLSNAVYDEKAEWPKVVKGKALMKEAVEIAVRDKTGEDELISKLFSVLDNESLPPRTAQTSFYEYLQSLRHTVFVPLLGGDDRKKVMEDIQNKLRDKRGKQVPETGTKEQEAIERMLARPEPPDELISKMCDNGMYGTQRQTVLLVDWNGRVRFVERALWDDHGYPIKRGEGDLDTDFTITGWEEED